MIDDYNRLISVVRSGAPVASRHGPTMEATNVQFMLPGTSLVIRQGMNMKLGWMEALQIISGVFDPELLRLAAPNAQHKLFTPSMAYGPRLGFQVEGVLNYLQANPDGRQATLWIARPSDGCSDEQTCTTTIHFLVRQGMLQMTVNMRSWDLVKGLPYDLMFFQLLKACVARHLGLTCGRLVVNAVSAHYYVEDKAKASSHSFGEFQFGLLWPDRWEEMRQHAGREIGSFEADGRWPATLLVTRQLYNAGKIRSWGEVK